MKQYFCVGTYTEPILFGTGEVFQGKGEGVYICSFEDGKIEQIASIPLRNPSFLCIDEKNHKIYTVNELKEYLGSFGGGVTELSYNGFQLTEERTFCTGGTDPCHIALAPNGRFLAVSNFASGSVSIFPVNPDGEMQECSQLLQHEGSSVHPVRQKGPHAHSAIFTGQDAFLVPDLGLDKVVAYRYSGEIVHEDSSLTLSTAAGNGPRYGEFSPDGKHFYLINEIGSSVTHYLWDGKALTERETFGTLPEDFKENNICSDLHITPDGKFLYASNRGHDSIAAFEILPDGALRLIERYPCGGRTPRNFALDPTGSYLLVGNQDTDSIVTFQIGADGRLASVQTTDFPTPVCIRFFLNSL